MRAAWSRLKGHAIYVCRLLMMPIIIPCAVVWLASPRRAACRRWIGDRPGQD